MSCSPGNLELEGVGRVTGHFTREFSHQKSWKTSRAQGCEEAFRVRKPLSVSIPSATFPLVSSKRIMVAHNVFQDSRPLTTLFWNNFEAKTPNPGQFNSQYICLANVSVRSSSSLWFVSRSNAVLDLNQTAMCHCCQARLQKMDLSFPGAPSQKPWHLGLQWEWSCSPHTDSTDHKKKKKRQAGSCS